MTSNASTLPPVTENNVVTLYCLKLNFSVKSQGLFYPNTTWWWQLATDQGRTGAYRDQVVLGRGGGGVGEGAEASHATLAMLVHYPEYPHYESPPSKDLHIWKRTARGDKFTSLVGFNQSRIRQQTPRPWFFICHRENQSPGWCRNAKRTPCLKLCVTDCACYGASDGPHLQPDTTLRKFSGSPRLNSGTAQDLKTGTTRSERH